MTAPVALYPLANSMILVAGTPCVAIYAPVAGGFITNPSSAADQGLSEPEVLYIDPTGANAQLQETATTIPLQPGETFTIPPNQATNISVNAVSAKHKFAGIVLQPPTPFPPAPQIGTFPPPGPTTLTQIIPSYLYQEYADDADLQAFVSAYNTLAQIYAAWFATIALPVYTGPMIVGALLDWVARGLYGMTRPALGSGLSRIVGPLNTYGFNGFPLNRRKTVGPQNVTVTTDDIFKRILTWNLYRGDGNTFDIRWLKRRVMRFLIGVNGTAPNIDQTYAISVTLAAGGEITIRIAVGVRSITGGALPNRFGFNQRVPLNSLTTVYVPPPYQPANPLSAATMLQEAFNAGVLQVPFQNTFAVLTGD